jgi:CheY-like chemotaxis protein
LTQHLFVTPDRTRLAALAAVIESPGDTINWASTGHQALEMLARKAVDMVVTDETLDDMTGLAFIKRLVAVNPLINSAAVSSLPEEAYHEASEGLGILMQLPPKPDRADGQRLMAHLNRVLGFTSTTPKENWIPCRFPTT